MFKGIAAAVLIGTGLFGLAAGTASADYYCAGFQRTPSVGDVQGHEPTVSTSPPRVSMEEPEVNLDPDHGGPYAGIYEEACPNNSFVEVPEP